MAHMQKQLLGLCLLFILSIDTITLAQVNTPVPSTTPQSNKLTYFNFFRTSFISRIYGGMIALPNEDEKYETPNGVAYCGSGASPSSNPGVGQVNNHDNDPANEGNEYELNL